MQTYVTTYPGNEEYLEDFQLLAAKFYDHYIEVHTAYEGEPKSDQLLRLCVEVEEDYVIILEEDFYLIKEADMALINRVVDFCYQNGVDRFSLQTKNAYSYTDWPEVPLQVAGHTVYQAPDKLPIIYATEASVWRVAFLQEKLRKGLSEWDIEKDISNEIRGTDHRVFALDTPILEYRDAMRRGTRIINLEEDPLRLVVKLRDGLALYPTGYEHKRGTAKEHVELCL